MASSEVTNVNIISHRILPSPRDVMHRLPLVTEIKHRIVQFRSSVESILDRSDPRIFVVVGPCSIHDPGAAEEYACRLHHLAEKVSDTLLVIMRVYFEKPRTVSGWKGFINDPNMDDSFDIEHGVYRARELLIHLAQIGLPAGTEALDPIMPQYLGDLVTWTAIGARTTESQTHREMASGLSTPVAFKNGTDGNVEVAINAVRSAATPHRFLGINVDGRCAVFHTRGNRYGHVVLRGGGSPNHDRVSIGACSNRLKAACLPDRIVVDCSHANSFKDASRQPLVFRDCIDQIAEGNRSIVGLMLESHLFAGRQEIPEDLSQLRYGVSVTDACIGWDTTAELLIEARERLADVVANRSLHRAGTAA